MQEELKRWHRMLAEVVGDLSLTIQKRSMTMRQVMTWKSKITAVQTEIAAFEAEQKTERLPKAKATAASGRKKRR